jgi:hypothetical protein
MGHEAPISAIANPCTLHVKVYQSGGFASVSNHHPPALHSDGQILRAIGPQSGIARFISRAQLCISMLLKSCAPYLQLFCLFPASFSHGLAAASVPLPQFLLALYSNSCDRVAVLPSGIPFSLKWIPLSICAKYSGQGPFLYSISIFSTLLINTFPFQIGPRLR